VEDAKQPREVDDRRAMLRRRTNRRAKVRADLPTTIIVANGDVPVHLRTA